MGKLDVPTHQRNGMGERGFPKWNRIQQTLNPSGRIRLKLNTLLLSQQMHFPERDGGQPELVVKMFSLGPYLCRELIRLKHGPEQDVSIEQKLHERRASHSSELEMGSIMSPVMAPELESEPSHDCGIDEGGGGPTCAIGSPLRRTRIGFFVRLTRARIAKHVALK